MNKNSHILVKTAFIAVIIVAISFIGCTTEEDLGPTDVRDNFIATWSATEFDATNAQVGTGTISITKKTTDTTNTRIYISNISNIGSAFKPEAIVSGSSFTIPSYNGSGYTVTGSGSYSASTGKISMSYTLNNGSGNENFTATLTK